MYYLYCTFWLLPKSKEPVTMLLLCYTQVTVTILSGTSTYKFVISFTKLLILQPDAFLRTYVCTRAYLAKFLCKQTQSDPPSI